MIRVLFIARYRDATMRRKVALLAQESDLEILHVCPRLWQDDLLRVEQRTAVESYRQVAVPMLGRSDDPHRAVYRTLGFGMPGFRPHVVHAEEEPDSLSALQIVLARRAFAPGAKLVLHTWQNLDRPKRWHVRTVLRASLAASDAIMCANGEAVALLAKLGYRKPAVVLPAIGVDTATFVPRPRGPEDGDPFVIGYAGRLVVEKGLDTLVAAVAALKRDAADGECGPDLPRQVRLVFVGDGPQREALEAQVRAAGLADRVRFKPAMPPAQVAEEISQLDVLVLPSRTTAVWKEQLGRVLIEAMACRVPVVGSDCGAIPEVIGDGGLVFPEGDATALAERLRRLMESPELRAELAERGYVRATTVYSQERIAERTAELYRRLVEWDRSSE